MKTGFLLALLFVLGFAFSAQAFFNDGLPNRLCKRYGTGSKVEDFHRRHAAQIAFENPNPLSHVWEQNVQVIVRVPISPTETSWVEVAKLRFYMNTTFNEQGCFWDERQAWERYDVNTGELIEFGLQRIDLFPNGPSYGWDFLSNDGDGSGLEERQSVYAVEWFEDRYLQESVSVRGLDLFEYSLGDDLVVGGWYRPSDNKVVFHNSIISFVPGQSRSYTYSTIEEAVPGDRSTAFKILATIDANVVAPPQNVIDAFDFLNDAIEDPNFVGRLNPLTGIEEIVYELPSSQAQRSVPKNCVNTQCHMSGLKLDKHMKQKAGLV